MNFAGFIESVRSTSETLLRSAQENSPEILAGFGVVAFLLATVSVAQAVHGADKDIEEKKEELDVEELPKVEVVKMTWKRFVIPTILVIIGVLCIFFSCKESHRRTMGMAAAYSLSQQRLQDHMAATEEVVGKKKEAEIRSATAQKAVNRTDLSENVIDTGTGHALWYIPETGEFMRASSTHINNIEANLTKTMAGKIFSDSYLSGDDVREALGLRPFANGLGDRQRLYAKDVKYNDYKFEFQRDYCSAPDGSPCCYLYVDWPLYDHFA